VLERCVTHKPPARLRPIAIGLAFGARMPEKPDGCLQCRCDPDSKRSGDLALWNWRIMHIRADGAPAG